MFHVAQTIYIQSSSIFGVFRLRTTNRGDLNPEKPENPKKTGFLGPRFEEIAGNKITTKLKYAIFVGFLTMEVLVEQHPLVPLPHG